MFSLFSGKSTKKCGLILDVGSGSVGAALVIVDSEESGTQTIWSYRETATIKTASTATEREKNICTTLLNVCLEVNAKGMPLLRNRTDKLQVTDVQVSIAAPFAHTITKTVRYTAKESFKITETLLDELGNKAQKQVHEQFADIGLAKQNLSLINDATIHVVANEYAIRNPVGQIAQTLALTHLIAVTSKSLLQTINETLDTIAPNVPRTYYSYMFLFYCSERNRRADTKDVCLLDITYEAAELGIVRDGVLTHIQHQPVGMYAIAREIAAETNVPPEEAYTYLQNDISQVTVNKKTTEVIVKVTESLSAKWSTLFRETDDGLGIPAVVELHTATNTDEYCSSIVEGILESIDRNDVLVRKTPHNPALDDTALHLATDFFSDHVDCGLTFA